MSTKYHIKQPTFLMNARKKYPCISTLIIVAAVTGLLLSGDSLAARDGTIGRTSTGQINISVYVPESVQVQNLQDINTSFSQGDSISTTNSATQSTSACIYSSSGAYTLTAQNTNGTNNGYPLLRGNENSLPYQLNVSDTSNNSSNNLLQTGSSVKLNSGSDTNCSAGGNLHIQMQLPNGTPIAPDHYRDIVNFTVAPV